MKKRILTFGVLLILVTISVVPGVVSAADSTLVMGQVVEGYTFAAPGPIVLGTMAPGDPLFPVLNTGSSTDGSLRGNNPNGYSVTGIDAKGVNTGYMVCGGGAPLANKHRISYREESYLPADMAVTFVDTSGPTDVNFSLYVYQVVEITDTPAVDYEIEITFTVIPKP